MKKVVVSSVFMVLFLFMAHALENNGREEILHWEKTRKLSWADFQGFPHAGSAYQLIGALTSSGIYYDKSCVNGYIAFDVQAYFEKHNSWVRDEARTDQHLSHEQVHFDITELYSRKITQALKEKSFKCEQDEEFEKFMEFMLLKWRSEQINYDLATNYSHRHQEQEEWTAKVQDELSELAE
ncbi:MAG: hypothetical protein AAF598_00035 [Bacteroidota bacterium]